MASVEIEEYEEIERPTGAFARQLLVEEQEDSPDSPGEVEEETNIAVEDAEEVEELDNQEEMHVNMLFDDYEDLETMPLTQRLHEMVGSKINGEQVYISCAVVHPAKNEIFT